MADQGFIVSTAEKTGISTAFDQGKVIILEATAGRDAKTKTLPQGAYWSHLEIHGTLTGAKSATTVQAMLFWDSACNDPASGVSSAATFGIVTGSATDKASAAISIDVWPTFTSDATAAGRVYLVLKVDASTWTCNFARLHWVVREKG